MDKLKSVVNMVTPYDKFASKWLHNLGIIGLVTSLIFLFVVFLALKLRLLSKFGMYLGGVGCMFLIAGAALLFNTPLLVAGNVFILAGLVLVIGFERTKTYYDIFRTNMCCGRGLLKGGFVIFLSGLLAQLLTKLPIIGRFYKWIPFVKDVVEVQTDEQLTELSRCYLCYEPEPEPWTAPGRLRSSQSSRVKAE